MDEEILIANKIPANSESYKGQFIVFFSEDENPLVLFSSFIAEEAYSKAKEIEANEGRAPIVIRVATTGTNNISQVLFARC